MEALLVNVNWLAVIVGAIAAFGLGALWYSPKMFGKGWMEGCGLTEEDAKKGQPMMAMVAQGVGTFLLAWITGITASMNSLGLAILIALMVSVLIKANGLFGKKNMYAIKVESGFILAMVVIMILVQAIF